MKNKLLELYELPKRLLMNEIGGMDCMHDSVFNLLDQECWGCDVGTECLSMLKVLQLEKEHELETLPEEKLLANLRIADQYINQKISAVAHSPGSCACELCNWSRETKRLLNNEDVKL
ncbi:MAG: hypothetical protein OEX83_10480 [Gammaproteobacteria bacterium]|nr:hypothetical protein [Gammaproteobacteria bacterium]